MVSIAGCLVFSAQPALTYLRGEGEGGGVRVEREKVEAKEAKEAGGQ